MKTDSLSTALASLTLLLLSACGPRAVERALSGEPLYREAITGWAVVDVASGERLHARGPTRLFTPASNAKILTLAAALAYLPPDSLPALAFREDGDTLRVWGLAYPLLAGDEAAYNGQIRQRLRRHEGPVEVSLHGFGSLPRFGAGWMWDDYGAAFSRERSGLPVYRNLATVRREDGRLVAHPDYLVVNASEVLPKGRLYRKEGSNRYTASAKTAAADTLRAPLFEAQAMAAQLLEDWTGRPIRYHARPLPPDWRERVWRGAPRDTLLRAMMLPSDNFLAEQILLQAALVGRDQTGTGALRRTSVPDLFAAVPPEQLFWADASGLSHYNLVSPEALTQVLIELHRSHPWPVLKRLFPTGGEPGTTLADAYAPAPGEAPWLWAKTGTLRHNHCLSGYLLADSGRLLAFSFMHNHFAGGSASYKEAMARSLRAIKEAY